MHRYFIIMLFLVLAACQNPGEPAGSNKILPGKDTIPDTQVKMRTMKPALPLADILLDSLNRLPFIITSNRYIDSFSHHRNGMAYIIDSTEKTWMIRAGFNGRERFESYYQFYVNPHTKEIKVYDAVNDEQIPLSDYMKKKN
jgi:hypothetical protein